MRRHTGHRRPGLSYVEAVFSVSILGGAMFSGLNMTGLYAKGEQIAEQQFNAQCLAQALMSEVSSRSHDGTDGSASTDGLRISFDRILDFDAWESPNTCNPEGTEANYYPIQPDVNTGECVGDITDADRVLDAKYRGYRRTVSIQPEPGGMAKIIIEVHYHTSAQSPGKLLCRLEGYKSQYGL